MNCYENNILRKINNLTTICIRNSNVKLRIGNTFFINSGEIILAYADDINTAGSNTTKTKEMLMKIETETYRRAGRDSIEQNITMDKYNFDCLKEFQYIGATITHDNHMDSEILARLYKGRCVYALQDQRKSRELSKSKM